MVDEPIGVLSPAAAVVLQRRAKRIHFAAES